MGNTQCVFQYRVSLVENYSEVRTMLSSARKKSLWKKTLDPKPNPNAILTLTLTLYEGFFSGGSFLTPC